MFYIEDNTQPYRLRSSRTGFFQAMRQFSQKVRRPFPFSCSRQKSELQWARFLSKSQKSHFGGIFRPFRPVKPFSENPLSVCLLLYDSPTLCKKSGKTEESFLRSCLVNRRTDKQSQINGTVPLGQVLKNVNYLNKIIYVSWNKEK